MKVANEKAGTEKGRGKGERVGKVGTREGAGEGEDEG